MLLTPRYGDASFATFHVPHVPPAEAMVRQRRRLGELMASLPDEAWDADTRCEEWTAKEVVLHLVSVTMFWAGTIAAGRAGTTTELLTSFDPVVSPDQLIAPFRDLPPDEVLQRYVATVDQVEESLAGMTDDDWDLLAEAPPGHLPMTGVVLHALWDSWLHERDIALPAGLDVTVDDEEVALVLVYAAMLGPGFLASTGDTRRGCLEIVATDPDVRFVVELAEGRVRAHDGDAPTDAVRLTGTAVALAEGLSARADLPCDVPDDRAWLLTGLSTVFDQP